MTIGDPVRTLYEHSETGIIVRPSKTTPPPSSEWHLVKFDSDGGKLFIHRDMLMVRN